MKNPHSQSCADKSCPFCCISQGRGDLRRKGAMFHGSFSTSSLVIPQTQASCGFPNFMTTDRDPPPFALASMEELRTTRDDVEKEPWTLPALPAMTGGLTRSSLERAQWILANQLAFWFGACGFYTFHRAVFGFATSGAHARLPIAILAIYAWASDFAEWAIILESLAAEGLQITKASALAVVFFARGGLANCFATRRGADCRAYWIIAKPTAFRVTRSNAPCG